MLRGAEREAAGMSGDPRQRPLLLLGWAPRQRGEGAVTILAPPGGPRHCRFLRKAAMCLVCWPVKRKFCKKKKWETLFEEQNFFFHELFRLVQPKRVVSAWNLDLAATSQTWACVR